MKQIGIFLLACILAAPVSQAKEDPKTLLKRTVDEVMSILRDESITSHEEKNKRLIEVVESGFSVQLIVRRCLGRHWNKFTEEQQFEFRELFGNLIVNTYTEGLRSSEVSLEYSFGKVTTLPKNRLEIKSVAKFSDENVYVDYRLVEREDDYEVYDIIVEGVSLTSNYRRQFDSLMKRGDAESLLQVLRDKLESQKKKKT